jgi:hypothetical protein
LIKSFPLIIDLLTAPTH